MPANPPSDFSSEQKLVMRLGPLDYRKFQRLEAIPRSDGPMLVFAMIHDKGVLLDDDPALFPSDTLITALRMLL